MGEKEEMVLKIRPYHNLGNREGNMRPMSFKRNS